MIEPRTVEIEQEYSSLKRSNDLEQNAPSKRTKCDRISCDEQYDSSTTDTETESKCSTSDIEETKLEEIDDNSDIEDLDDDSNISTDQSRYIPVVLNQINPQPSLSRYARKLIKQFRIIYDRSQRKTIELTQCTDEKIKTLRWELRNTFHRTDLLNEGYAVLSDESFPFYSLCFMCGSMGTDLIYCNSCCQAYHTACLNDCERPHLYPTPESWVCPNCTICNICGLSMNSPIISCADCQRSVHIKCLKQTKDEQQSLTTHHQVWYCPLCIKCDCGQSLVSNERNLLSLTNSVSSQQSLMCSDCLNNMKIIRTNKTDQIEKCHLCDKFIEQFSTKSKPLFSVSLIGNQSKQKVNNLLQCMKCKHRFHPKCDGYLLEDVTLIPYVKNICANVICSKCDRHQRELVGNSLVNYKLQVVKSIIASITSTLQIMISDETRLNNMKRYMCNLQQLHQSRNQSLNLHAFLNDLLIIVQRLLDNLDSRQWQAAIDNCLIHLCPWFKSSNLSTHNKTLFCSSTNTSISSSNVLINRCLPSPSIDHTYSLNNERLLFESNLYKTNLLTSSDSLLRYIDNKLDEKDSFENLHHIDTRICQLCQTYAEHFSSNISRLISIGVNHWVHIGCILPAYTKTLDQPPYVLNNIREIVDRCQTKHPCDICFKMGASVQCYENECHAHFHCQCIELYYSKFDRSLQEQWNMINGLLPNLTTLCSKHNRRKLGNEPAEINNDLDISKLQPINLSSTIYADLSNSVVEFSLPDIQLCIGSLHIKSLGNFDYLLDHDPNLHSYPNQYHASRLFWSTKNVRQKTVYHLHIEIEQTYHQEKSNHQTVEYPLSNEQISLEQFYQTCERYFKKFDKPVSRQKVKNLTKDISHHQLKQLSSCMKCPTSKTMLRNLNRPRDRCKNEPDTDIAKSAQSISEQKTEAVAIETKSLRNLFANDLLKSTNLSQFTRAIEEALQRTDRSLPSTKILEQQPIFSYYLSDENESSSNGLTIANNDDAVLKQLLKTMNLSQQLHDTQLSAHPQSVTPLTVHGNTTETNIPQIDGTTDDDDGANFYIASSVLNTSIEHILESENHFLGGAESSQRQSIDSEALIQRYQQWLSSKFGRTKFTITSDDGYRIVSDNLDNAWASIVHLVRACRDDMKLTHVPMTNDELNGHHIFGLTKPIIKILLNQIYLNSCSTEEKNSTIVLPLSSTRSNHQNSTGFIKTKMKTKKLFPSNSRSSIYQRKNSQRQRFNWLSNPNRRISYALKSFEIDAALAYARQILLEESSVSVRLYHLHYFSERALLIGSSSIHGCGLFTLIDLIEGQMVIEYTGEVVRPCLTDKHERENERKGFGCYMFTVDSTSVIDATHQGNKARFINHHCQPNCFAKTVVSGGVKHIVIYALIDIIRGSELTYDYSFPEEDVKIPCRCGTSNCRVYLN